MTDQTGEPIEEPEDDFEGLPEPRMPLPDTDPADED
jgi:hypothetical protein